MAPSFSWSGHIRLWIAFFSLFYLLEVSSCSAYIDPALQTPISRETLDAYPYNTIIHNQRQAAIAALKFLGETRVEYDQPPKVVSASRMSGQEARRVMATKGEVNNTIPKSEVWLVIFEGDFRIVPPGPEITPGAFGHRCVWVAVGDNLDLGAELKAAPCDK